MSTDFGIMKFKLACRQFQKGLANFSILKANYTRRDLLDNDLDFPDNRRSTRFNDGRDSELLLDKETGFIEDFDKMLSDRQTNDAVKEDARLDSQQWGVMIVQIEKDFSDAIGNLGQNTKANVKSNNYMLDFAILIALYYCELNFMCRIIPEAKKPGAKENHQRPFN